MRKLGMSTNRDWPHALRQTLQSPAHRWQWSVGAAMSDSAAVTSLANRLRHYRIHKCLNFRSGTGPTSVIAKYLFAPFQWMVLRSREHQY